MFEPDKIRELINQIPEIRSRFSNEDITFFSGYDFRERKRTNASMGVEMIYKDSKFIRWRDELIIELSALREETIVAEIIHKLQHFTGLGDKKKFDDVESKLLTLDKKLDEYKPTVIEKEISDVRIDEEALVKDILMSVVNLQKNHTYTHTSKENEMNDFIRDMLGMKYEKVDQTRQGDSVSGKDAGSIDIQLLKDGMPVVMIEALKLSSLDQNELSIHIDKVLKNYDPNGCPYAVILVYATMAGFDEFHKKFIKYLNEYEFPYLRETDIVDVDTDYTEIKHVQTILKRTDKRVRVHFFTVHIN